MTNESLYPKVDGCILVFDLTDKKVSKTLEIILYQKSKNYARRIFQC
jgi:hypothetical protein